MYHIYGIDMKIKSGKLTGAEELIESGKSKIYFDPILSSSLGLGGKHTQ
jgi:hypothetical protein